MGARIDRLRARALAGERGLHHLGPMKVLDRGYSITRLEGSTEALRDASRAHGGQTLLTRLARGEVRSLVRSATSGSPASAPEIQRQPSLFDNLSQSGAEPEDNGADHGKNPEGK
jgi:hypothetical protein